MTRLDAAHDVVLVVGDDFEAGFPCRISMFDFADKNRVHADSIRWILAEFFANINNLSHRTILSVWVFMKLISIVPDRPQDLQGKTSFHNTFLSTYKIPRQVMTHLLYT